MFRLAFRRRKKFGVRGWFRGFHVHRQTESHLKLVASGTTTIRKFSLASWSKNSLQVHVSSSFHPHANFERRSRISQLAVEQRGKLVVVVVVHLRNHFKQENFTSIPPPNRDSYKLQNKKNRELTLFPAFWRYVKLTV